MREPLLGDDELGRGLQSSRHDLHERDRKLDQLFRFRPRDGVVGIVITILVKVLADSDLLIRYSRYRLSGHPSPGQTPKVGLAALHRQVH